MVHESSDSTVISERSDAETDLRQAASTKRRPSGRFIAGIGASAGGLEALERLFAAMPLDTGISFVVIQHLSPDFESHMEQLLGRVTRLPIRVVTDGLSVQPNTIYLIPPKMEMVISNGRLLLTERSPERTLSHPIDQFMRALAHDSGDRAIGIVLSGTGSDGSRGISDIKEAGGLVIAQTPATCKFDAMPSNAQKTGHVHLVLPPESIGKTLAEYVRNGDKPGALRDRATESLQEKGVQRVFQLLQAGHGIDFSHYKASTVGRRIQRRMDLNQIQSLERYVERLSSDRIELNELYKDLLIGVTSFFRDREAFEILGNRVIPDIIERHSGDAIRVWVCGCATGEEAYSLAMLFAEGIAESGKAVDFKMFATDAHQESLNFAAAGVYPSESLEQLNEERRERFFIKRQDGYLVSSELRRMIVFAPHNVVSDPPFTQMDLVSCRNLLIYLQPVAQRKTLSLFHFALKSSGVLFLGPSESPGEIGDEFDALDSHWRIYRKRRDVRLPLEMRMPLGGGAPASSRGTTRTDGPPRRSNEVVSAVYDALLARVMPPGVLVDDRFEILHTFAGSESFLRLPPGRPTANLVDMIHPSIKSPLLGALQHALKGGKVVRYSGLSVPGLSVPGQAAGKQLRLIVEPISVPRLHAMTLLVTFDVVDAPPDQRHEQSFDEVNINQADAERIESLEVELTHTRQNLQATIEELESSNEELQASNEEMVAANEELQSTNEELHSVNEELYTVNAEHQRRLAELDQAHNDMNNLLASTRVGVIFLDRELRIRRYTPEIGRLFQILPQDVGRSIEGFSHVLTRPDLVSDLRQVVDTESEREFETRDASGQAYLVRALPYRTGSQVAGIVVALINVHSLKSAQEGLERFKFMCDAAFDSQALIDRNGKFCYVNPMMAQRLGYRVDQLLEKRLMDVEHDLDAGRLALLFETAEKTALEPYETVHRRRDGSTYPAEVSVTRVTFGESAFLYVTARDITRRKRADEQLRLLEKAIASVANGIILTDPSQPDNPVTYVNNGFLTITGYDREEVIGRNCRLLQGEATDPKTVARIRRCLEKGEPFSGLLENYRKDGSIFWNDLNITPVRDEEGNLTHFVGVQNDVTESVLIGERARQSENTIRLLLDSTAEGIYGIDADGICIFCNRSAAAMLGYDSPADLVHQPIHDLVHHTRADSQPYPRGECEIASPVRTGHPVNRTDEVFWRRDGSGFPVEYWSYPIQNGNAVVGAVVTFLDITERQRTEAELRKARLLADAANQAKSHFLANMSHELRTPMTAVLGFAEILLHETGDEQVREKLLAICSNGNYLLKLLNDVLDLSQVEAGVLQVERSQASLGDVLQDLHEVMQMRARDLDRRLRFHIPAPLPVTITTDPARLRQVLINLISNGLKFAPDGEVDVTVRLQQTDDPLLEVEVADNGIGMSPEQLSRLFKPFSQGDTMISREFGGTGLGLSISARLVESLGGTIEVDSQSGRGSSFVVRLPVGPVGPLEHIQLGRSAAAAGQPVERPDVQLDARVLVADDMRDIQYIVRHFLSKAGCEVTIAENGRLAVEAVQLAAAEGRPFDILFLDVRMPEMSGQQALEEIRRLGYTMPVIALTAEAMKGTREQLLAAGFNGYITKPIDAAEMLTNAQRLLREHS